MFLLQILATSSPLVQPKLPYQEPRKFERNNGYRNRDQDAHIFARGIYIFQDTRAQEYSQNHISQLVFFNVAIS